VQTALDAKAIRARLPAIGCFVVLLALISPRLALVALWLFGDLLSRAYDSVLLPLAGFFLLPWTTLAYALLWSSGRTVDGIEWLFVVLGFLFDIGALGGGSRARSRD
jgi:hypothetical protein